MSSVYEKVKSFKERYPETVAFRLEEHSKVAEKVLDKDEKILYAFASGGKTYVYIFTDKRFIRVRKKLLWGDNICTYNYSMFKETNINPLRKVFAHKGLVWNNIEIEWINDKWCWCIISGLDPASVNEITNNIYKSVDYVYNNNRENDTEVNEKQFQESSTNEKNRFLHDSKAIESNEESLRLKYYMGVHKLLKQEYNNCKTKEERNIVLEKMKENVEAYKKEKESQMKLTLK